MERQKDLPVQLEQRRLGPAADTASALFTVHAGEVPTHAQHSRTEVEYFPFLSHRCQRLLYLSINEANKHVLLASYHPRFSDGEVNSNRKAGSLHS